MKLNRFFHKAALLVTLGAALTGWTSAQAQAVFPQPGKTIRLLVGLPAGGPSDTQARAIAQKLSEVIGTQVIVDNKPGASTMIAAYELIKSPPDGHTLMFAASSLFAQNPHTLSSVKYDPFKDFTPITMATRGPLVLTLHTSVPATTVKELVTWAKANPGKLNFANFGTGTSSHVYAEAFSKSMGIEAVHVPYKGSAEATSDLLEGRVQAYFDPAPSAIINTKTGKVRMLGVAASKRSPFLPDVPTLAEAGAPGLDLPSWVCIIGPAGMSPELVRKVNAALVQALNSQQVKDSVAKGAYEATSSTPAELAAEIRSAYDRWGDTIQKIGFVKR